METETAYQPTQRQIDILHHSLGMTRANYRRARSWWMDDDKHRNYFATADDCDHFQDCVTLASAGLMERGRAIPGGLVYYHVTEAGIDLAKQHRPV